jgi:hypothetical protein
MYEAHEETRRFCFIAHLANLTLCRRVQASDHRSREDLCHGNLPG